MENKRGRFLSLVIFLNLLLVSRALTASTPIQLAVNATDAGRNLLHAQLEIPVVPGKLTLFYPKWIPGEHMPDGPINGLTDLHITANGQPLDWQRDADDMYTFHLTVPEGVNIIEVSLDFIMSTGSSYTSGASATARLLDLNWNQVLLYPKVSEPLKLPYQATLTLPTGWKYGTALPLDPAAKSGFANTDQNTDQTTFQPAPLGTLIDSPLIAGEYFRSIELTPGKQPAHYLQIAADDPADLVIKPEDIARFQRLVAEANALFGAHHYRDYHFLVTLSDQVAHFGLEHHESSDDRLAADFLTNPDTRELGADLLPHEMTHSWNGKYRRPAGLATPDYQKPMEDELLWVYEGLTDYYGKVLAARSGLLTGTNFQEAFALNAAALDHRTGRQWRSLADTAISAPLLYEAAGPGGSRRRGVDFYPEGDLIWLEVDTLIRQQTQDQKSLDDFCKLFHGGKSGPPEIVPYTYDDVVNTLNQVAPYDWKAFFQKRIYETAPRAPIGGIENGGWQLVYTNEVPYYQQSRETQRKYTDAAYSLGFTVSSGGDINDVLPGSPADQAGMVEGMKLIAVNGRGWSAKLLRDAIKSAATNSVPIELLTSRDDYYHTYPLDYHGGEQYPMLIRDSTKPDYLNDIIKPLTPESMDVSTNFIGK